MHHLDIKPCNILVNYIPAPGYDDWIKKDGLDKIFKDNNLHLI